MVAVAFAVVGGASTEDVDRESITSRNVLSSSSAASHFPARISEASFPQ